MTNDDRKPALYFLPLVVFFVTVSTSLNIPGMPLWEYLIVGLEAGLITVIFLRYLAEKGKEILNTVIVFLSIGIIVVGFFGYSSLQKDYIKVKDLDFTSQEPSGLNDYLKEDDTFHAGEDIWIYLEVHNFNLTQDNKAWLDVFINIENPEGYSTDNIVGFVNEKPKEDNVIPIWFKVNKYLPKDPTAGDYTVSITVEDSASEYYEEKTISGTIEISD